MVMEVNTTHMRNITAAFAPTGLNTSAIFAPRQASRLQAFRAPRPRTAPQPHDHGNYRNHHDATYWHRHDSGGHADYDGYSAQCAEPHIECGFFDHQPARAALEAVLNDSLTKVLQAPQIRAVDNQKATLKIGEKVPTASGSFQRAWPAWASARWSTRSSPILTSASTWKCCPRSREQ